MKTKRTIAIILSVIMLFGLTGCGDTKAIKSAKFVDTINQECGAPPEVLSAIYVYYIQGSGNESALQANLRLAADEGFRDNSKNRKLDYQLKTDSLAVSDGSATVESTEKKKLYWGCYVLSDDKEVAEEMRQAYIDALEDMMWKNIPSSEYASYEDDGSLYYFQGHSVYVDKVIGPVYWDVKEDSGETLYGMIVFYY